MSSEMGEENSLASRLLALFSPPVAGCVPLASQTRVTPNLMDRPQRESKFPPLVKKSFPLSESRRVVGLRSSFSSSFVFLLALAVSQFGVSVFASSLT